MKFIMKNITEAEAKKAINILNNEIRMRAWVFKGDNKKTDRKVSEIDFIVSLLKRFIST